MPAKKVFMVFMILILCLLPIKESIASPIIEKQPVPPMPPAAETSTGVAPTPEKNRSVISSLSGSNVTFDPAAGGSTCYAPAVSQTLCFQSESFTSDYEYVYNNWIKFPSDWIVSNVYLQGTPTCTTGSWGTFSWSFQTSPYEVNIAHPRYQSTTDHCVATYCVDVTPAGVVNEAPVSWFFDGDGYAGAPHNPCSSDGYTPAGQNACDEMVAPVAAVPACSLVPQVILSPEQIVTTGCHGNSKSQTMTLTNLTGAESTFDITYDKNFSGDFFGPTEITLANGANIDFEVYFAPHICASDGDYVATLAVSDGAYSDQSTVNYKVYTELHEWQQIPSNPVPFMDNVLAGYDGKVWSLTGYGTSLSDVSFYDPSTDTWTTIPASSPPWGVSSYPRSGCQMGNEVFVYGDTFGAYTGLWSYNMDTNVWAQETPGGTPPPNTGIWAPSWVADTDTGLCYMTGGATVAGGGNLATVYVYDVIANAWTSVFPPFTTVRDFHAAFLFIRPSDSHKLLCVAGGNNGAELTSTQCYDFSTGMWNAENADLGALPAALWGMGYTQRMTPTGEQLWLVAGAYNGTPTNLTWFYDLNANVWVGGGALETSAVYRTAAVALDDTVYHVGGSVGSFNPSGNANKTVDTICPACVVPGFTKQANEFAYPGQTIHYNISVGDPSVSDTAFVTDYLPDSVDYVSGSLSVSPAMGSYGYDSTDRMIWWHYAPALPKTNGWTPAEKSGTSSSTEITTQSGASAAVTQSASPDYTIESVLWDQPLSTINTNAYVDQEFSDFPAYSSFLADDFVAESPWFIDTIFVPGYGFNGFTTLFNATALTFMIYEDNAGVPAGDPSGGGILPIWALSLPPTDPQLTITNGFSGVPSNTQLDLNVPILLPAGHYWLIFYPTLEFGTAGQYGRQAADTVNLDTAQIINPGGGFGFGTEWQPWTVLGAGLTQTDIAFRIEGTELAIVHIQFDAIVSAPLNQSIWNYADLYYGDYQLHKSASTFTGYGSYLPLTIK